MDKHMVIALFMTAILTTAAVMTSKAGTAVVLGMVSTLSFTRARTPVKDALDLVFLFWAVAIGMLCGAQMYQVAVIASLIITGLILGLDGLYTVKNKSVLMIALPDPAKKEQVIRVLEENTKKYQVLSDHVRGENLNMTISVVELAERDILILLKEKAEAEYISVVSSSH